MTAIFLKLLNLSITATWLILAVVLVRLLLKKAPKWISCLLWAFVAIRLIFPFSIESVLSLVPSSETIPADIAYMQNPAVHSGISALNSTVNPIISQNLTPNPGDSANPLQIILPIMTAIWLAGTIVLLIYAFVSWLRLRKTVCASVPVKDNIMACDDVQSPFILGVFKPVIYVPSSLSGQTLDYVITHEMTHIKRRDYLWKPFGYILMAVYWFNPFCLIAYILLCRDIEMACDEKVIRDMSSESKAGYSQALLDCSVHRRLIAACPLAFGEVGVKQRVKGVLNYKKPAFWIIIVAVIACIAVAVCFLTNPKRDSFELKIVVPAHSQSQFYYSDEQVSPLGNRITLNAGANLSDTEVVLKTVEVKEENSYEPVYLTHGMSVKMDVEKGAWFCVGVYMNNPTDEDISVSVVVDNIVVRIAEEAVDPPHNTMIATITEFENGSMMVTPIEGSWELSSSDVFRVPIQNMNPSPEPVVGDKVEIVYNGCILETYPASFENVVSVTVIREDSIVSNNETYYNLSDQGKLKVSGSTDSNHSFVQSQMLWTNSTKISIKNNSGTDVTVYLFSVENESTPILEMTLSKKEEKTFTNLSSQYIYYVRISADPSANVSVDISD